MVSTANSMAFPPTTGHSSAHPRIPRLLPIMEREGLTSRRVRLLRAAHRHVHRQIRHLDRRDCDPCALWSLSWWQAAPAQQSRSCLGCSHTSATLGHWVVVKVFFPIRDGTSVFLKLQSFPIRDRRQLRTTYTLSDNQNIHATQWEWQGRTR